MSDQPQNVIRSEQLSDLTRFVSDLIDRKYHKRVQVPQNPVTDSSLKISDDSHLSLLAQKLNELAESMGQQVQQQDEAQRIAKIGNWSFDLKSGHIHWSKELYNLHPVESRTEPPDFAALCQMIHSEDRLRFQALVEKCIQTGTPYHSTHRIVFPDRILWMDAFGQARYDSNGEIIGLVGTAQDVTEQMEREELSRFILDAVQIGVWKFNPNDQSLFWDKSMYEIFDVRAEDFQGHYQAWESTLTPEAKATAVEELSLALQGKKEFDTIFEIETKSRGRRFISGRGRVVRDTTGKPLMMYGVNIDVTAQKSTEIERERISKFLELVLQNIPSMIFAKDCRNQFRFSMLNKAGEEILGMPASDFVGKSDYDMFPKEKADQLRAADMDIVSTGKALTIKEITVQTPSGSKVLQTIKFPIYDEAKNPAYVIGISNDITEDLEIKKSLEVERTKSFRNAKLASLGEMSAGIAHEINNPLAIISSSLSLLEKFKDNPEKFAAKIKQIENATFRISRIVKGLKKFSRSDTKSHRQPFELQTIINDSLVLTEAKAKQNSTSIIVDVAMNVKILCDEVEIEQVIVNLINNAIDAVKNLSERWIRISALEDGTAVVLRVEDSGAGIPKEVREKLFEPFFTTKNIGEGTGLGLSISKGILDEHGASIAVLDPSATTCFEIRFPQLREKSYGT